jgi:hypothetical protein
MTAKTTADEALVLDASTMRVVPTPVNLHDIEAVRREMARVYRDMRGRKIDSQDGTRLVYALTQIAKLHEAVDLVRRLDRLEDATYDDR